MWESHKPPPYSSFLPNNTLTLFLYLAFTALYRLHCAFLFSFCTSLWSHCKLVMRIQTQLHVRAFTAFRKDQTISISSAPPLCLYIHVHVKEWEHNKACTCISVSLCPWVSWGTFGCCDESNSHGDGLRGVQYKRGNDVTRTALKSNSHRKQKTITPSPLPLSTDSSLCLLYTSPILHPFLLIFSPAPSFSAERLVSVVIIHRAQRLSEVS